MPRMGSPHPFAALSLFNGCQLDIITLKCNILHLAKYMVQYMGHKISSLQARRALESMGANIKTARLKRRISVADFAERIGVSKNTVISLEKGEAGVSMGTLAMACLVLGEIDRIGTLLDAGTDETGLLLDKEALPKRINTPRPKAGSSEKQSSEDRTTSDDDGVSF